MAWGWNITTDLWSVCVCMCVCVWHCVFVCVCIFSNKVLQSGHQAPMWIMVHMHIQLHHTQTQTHRQAWGHADQQNTHTHCLVRMCMRGGVARMWVSPKDLGTSRASHHLSTVMRLMYIFLKTTRFPNGCSVLGGLLMCNSNIQCSSFETIKTIKWFMMC